MKHDQNFPLYEKAGVQKVNNKYFKKYLKGVIRVLFLIFVEMN